MVAVAFSIVAVLLALLQVTWFEAFALLPLVLVLVSVFVDVVPATVAALVAGLVLDLLGLRVAGIPVSVVLLGLVGILEVLRLAVRTLAERQTVFALSAALVVGALHGMLRGTAFASAGSYVFLTAAHGLAAFALLPVARIVGAMYQSYLRERGVIS